MLGKGKRKTDVTVIVDGKERGQTQIIIELKRKREMHRIEVVKDGFYAYSTDLVRKTSAGSSVGNMFIDFGLISHLVVGKAVGGSLS